jgi:polysaccharide deacetylase 2 family uncharacterized protein YibQ
VVLLALTVAGVAIWSYLRGPGAVPSGPPSPLPSPTAQVSNLPTVLPTPPAPRICLIIDDGGYQRGAALQALYAIHSPITVSIIPDVAFSKALAEEFPAHGVEVMCHMPMQGHEKGMVGSSYKALLRKGMDPSQARKDVESALEGLPHCRGLNNHMGSVATEDLKLMETVCDVLKERGLYAIDSRTTAKSQVARAARELGVPCASRDVFLDNVEETKAIQAQLERAALRARKKGLSVAIGHFKTTTLRTLGEAIPQLEAMGFRFVYASEIVK